MSRLYVQPLPFHTSTITPPPPPHSAMAVPRRYRVGVRVTSALTALLVVFLWGYWTRSGLSHSTPHRDHPLDTASLTNDHHPNLHHRHLMSYHGDSNGSHGDNSSYKCENPLHPPPSYHGDSCQFVRDHCSGEAQLINYLAFITCNMKDVKVCFVFGMWYPIFCLPFCLSACLSVCPICLSPTLSLSLSLSLSASFPPSFPFLTTSPLHSPPPPPPPPPPLQPLGYVILALWLIYLISLLATTVS